MSLIRKLKQRRKRRAARVRARLQQDLPRVSIYKSLNQIYAQIIDDNAHRTLISFSSLQLQKRSGDKKEIAFEVGKQLAQKAIVQGIVEAAFDRGPFLFHGRVKALADGLREGGLRV